MPGRLFCLAPTFLAMEQSNNLKQSDNPSAGPGMTVEEWLNGEALSIDIWKRKYQQGDETFEQWLDRVSGGNQCIRQLIKEQKFIFAGRILSNRGVTDRKITYSNCYCLTPPQDSLESIFDAGSKLARTFSYGGGCGLDISNLRPKNAPVNNAAKSTSGTVSFMDFYSYITGLIGQEGRRGALMISISCEHPDLVEFINLKSNLDVCTKANISVRMTDAFMQAVESGSDFTLHFTMEDGSEITKIVNAREVFMLLAQRNWEMAEPGILYWDRIANYNLLQNTGFKYAGVNPCVTGDTLVLTENGYASIASLVGHKCVVWNGYEWSEVKPKLMENNAQVYEISFSDGTSIKCTDYHKFPINTGTYHKAVDTRKQLKDIKVGEKLIKCAFPIICGPSENSGVCMYTQGFFSGDGYYCADRVTPYIKFYGRKKYCIPFCDTINQRGGDSMSTTYSVNVKYHKEFVPDTTFSVQDRLDWLAGIIDSDGCRNSKDGAISISSINRDFLLKIKYMLNTLGSTGVISLMHEEDSRQLPSSVKGESKEYHCQDSYRLTINASNMRILLIAGLKTHRVEVFSAPNRNATRFIKVESIVPCGKEDVFCFNEPKNHTFIANGCITGNCAEEPLPAGGSCLLGSINLSKFVENPFTGHPIIRYDDLAKAVECAIYALNDVLMEGLPLHPLQEQRDSVAGWRQIGLGTMGLGDLLLMCGLKYGAPESISVIKTIYHLIASTAVKTSLQLAKDKGCFPNCTPEIKEAMTKCDFIRNLDLPQEVLYEIKEYGLYNSQLLTCAPTGTIGTMLQVSTGVEPNYAFSYNRRTVSLHKEETDYKVDSKIVADYKKVTGSDALPEYFVSAEQIPYERRIEVQATLQRFIDASISSTVNLPNSTTVEDVANLYLLAWKKGLKGTTIWRDGCQRQAILTKEEKKTEEKPGLKRGEIQRASDDLVGKKRTLQTGCGTLHLSAWFDKNTGELVETFFSKGSTGGCALFMTGLSRMTSLAARAGAPIEAIVDQLLSSGTCPSYAVRTATKKDTSKGSSCPVAIGNALLDMCRELQLEQMQAYRYILDGHWIYNNSEIAENPALSPKCPKCGEPIQMVEGCMTCPSCGYSKCS